MPEKVTKLLAESVALILEPEGALPLKLKIAWTMRACMIIEKRLREYGDKVNVLHLSSFWDDMDATRLAVSIWACAQQEQREYANEEGLEIIASYITPDNYNAAITALKDAFLQSLSEKRREEIKAAAKAAESNGVPQVGPPQDPPAAQTR